MRLDVGKAEAFQRFDGFCEVLYISYNWQGSSEDPWLSILRICNGTVVGRTILFAIQISYYLMRSKISHYCFARHKANNTDSIWSMCDVVKMWGRDGSAG